MAWHSTSPRPEFERDLTQERIRSGIAAAKARGKRLGRQPGQRPKSDRLAPKVLALVEQGLSSAWSDEMWESAKIQSQTSSNEIEPRLRASNQSNSGNR
jgi:DNA invertase Pin-like site-specific DNA recombinase